MAKLAKFLQGVAGAAGGEGLNVEQVFSTYLYEGQENRVVKSEITSSESRTDNHIAYSFTLANNLGADYTNTTESNLTTDADLSILSRSASSTVDNTTDRKLAMGLYSSSSEGKYYQSLYKNTSTVDSFSVAGTFPYGTATGVSVVEVRNGFNFSSSTAVQSGDLLLFVAVGKNSSYAAASGFTEIDAVTETGGTYGFMARIAAKIADGTENGTDFGDNFLLSTSGSEYGILLRKTGGSWDISGAASGAALTSTNDVVSTLIDNSIDLAGEGGLVWIKGRDYTGFHNFTDTERGPTKNLFSNSTSSEVTATAGNDFASFNSNGFTLSKFTTPVTNTNDVGYNFASWTFRKAPKFFDVVTYTGDGTDNHTISHNLGTDIGTIMIKCTSHTSNWVTWHRTFTQSGNSSQFIYLNSTGALASDTNIFNGFSTTNFTVGGNGAGASDFNTHVNTNGRTYVAYLFAHNDGDGEFGPTGDQDIIKCGSHTNSAEVDELVDLGWEPQWILTKKTNVADDWKIFDTMRGLTYDLAGRVLKPNSSNAEADNTASYVRNTGFTLRALAGHTSIYIAIRRGPMAVPTDATDVFAIDTASGSAPEYTSNFPVDMGIIKDASGSDGYVTARLTKTLLRPNTTAAESAGTGIEFDYQDGYGDNFYGADASVYSWMWKRAPNYFDVVNYVGNSSPTVQTIQHRGLGVAPEMIWIKNRDGVYSWRVYHKDLGATKFLELDTTDAAATSSSVWYNTEPTDSEFYVGISNAVSQTGSNHIAYLFASLDGVSKVGSFTHTSGTATNVDCGFSNGARFVLLKYYDQVSDWWVFDTVRGIAVGNDARLILNQPYAETSTDQIDPYSAGFTYDAARASGDIIFYAIA